MKSDTKAFVCIGVSIAVLVFIAACERRPSDPAPDDSEISLHLREKFSADSGLQSRLISAEAQHGTVTLTGSVNSETERAAAEQYARSERGVKKIVNRLAVWAPPPAASPADWSEKQISPRKRPLAPERPAEIPAKLPASQAAVPDPPPVTPATARVTEPFFEPAALPPPKVTIPAGTSIVVRLIDTISSETAVAGQPFEATLESPLAYQGDVVVPAGYVVEGHVSDAKSAGKFAGKPELTLQLDRLVVLGKTYDIETDRYHRTGASRGKETATKVGAGAVIGGLIGGLSGGGKGAAIGAAAGSALGGAVQATNHGQPVQLRSETRLNFTLESPVTVTPTSESASELAPRRLQPAADDCASRDGHGRGCKDKRESDYDKPPREKGGVLWP